MDIKLELAGTTPLLCHSVSLVDPDNPWVKEIATYTGKRRKTEEDRRAIARLEWFGGLYVEDGRAVMPTANLRKMLIEAGKISKQGTQIQRALSFIDLNVPIVHNGPSDLEALFADPAYVDISAVGVARARVMRCRPKFPHWALVAGAFLLDDVMDLDDLARVAQRAGAAIGLGDNRVNGYGRFQATLTSSA